MNCPREHVCTEKGFTLIELMVVVAVIGILAAIAVPNFLGLQEKSKRRYMAESAASAKSELHNWLEASISQEPGVIDIDGDGIVTIGERAPLSLMLVPGSWIQAMERKKGESLQSPWNPHISLYKVGVPSAGQIGLVQMAQNRKIMLLGLDLNGNTIFKDTISIE